MELSRDRLGYDSAVSTASVLPDSGTVVQFRTHEGPFINYVTLKGKEGVRSM